MAKIIQRFIATEFGKVKVRIAGYDKAKKPALLCLHMVPQSGEDFEAFMEVVGVDRCVIAIDYPGYGDSDPMDAKKDVSIDTYAQVCWQVVDNLKFINIDILGYHTGSKVGIEMALQYPDRVAKLYCISLSSMTPEMHQAYKPDFSPLSNRKAQDWMRLLRNYYVPDLPENILERKYITSMKQGSRSHLGFQASHDYNAKILERLAQLETPVGLINPNDDLKDITPKAANYIQRCVFIERPDWRPGFLDLKAQSVSETIVQLSLMLDQLSERSSLSMVS